MCLVRGLRVFQRGKGVHRDDAIKDLNGRQERPFSFQSIVGIFHSIVK